MGQTSSDVAVLRQLAEQYAELCASDHNQAKIGLWRNLNSKKPDRPVVWANLGLLGPDIERVIPARKVEDDELADVEYWLKKMIWTATIGDDRVLFPWYTVRARMATEEGDWGIPVNRIKDAASRGWRDLPMVSSPEDLKRLKPTEHRVIDPHPLIARRLNDIFNGILPVHINRATVYRKWGGTDLSEAAGRLFGLSELLYALYDKPVMVHDLMAFMRDAVVANLNQCEAAGDFSTAESENYLVPAYCDDLPDPAPNTHGVAMKDLCFFTHSQEFECVGPEQHREFLLNYQVPIMALYNRVAYGCCETLDTKLDLLSEIPNLHKVLAGPLADLSIYPHKVDPSCIISWRPNAAPMVCRGFDPDGVRGYIRHGFELTKGHPVELHLHEPMTVEGDLSRVSRWAEIAVQEAERVA